MMLFVWALIPPIFVILLFYLLDPNKKPLKAIGKVLAWSFIAFVPLLLSVIIKKVLHIENWLPTEETTLRLIDNAFLAAAIPEEVGKWLALYFFVKKSDKFFHFPYDGIFYGACIGAFFAGVENIYYLSIGYPVLVRVLMSLPGHTMHALIMGHFFALIRYGADTWRNKIYIFLLPILFHGFWDLLLFLMWSDAFGKNGNILLLLFVLALFIIELIYCIRLTKSLRRCSIS